MGHWIHSQLMPDLRESQWSCTDTSEECTDSVSDGQLVVLGWRDPQRAWPFCVDPWWLEAIGELHTCLPKLVSSV